jgi:hypothetical protein
MVRGWLRRGVDGFRLDVFNAFLKDPELRSNPVIEGHSPWSRLDHLHDIDQPDFPELIERFRAIVDEAPGRMSVGELFSREASLAAKYARDRHIVFDWSLMESPRRPRPSRRRSTCGNGSSGRTPGPPSPSRTTTGNARRPACRHPSVVIASRTATRSPGRSPSSS